MSDLIDRRAAIDALGEKPLVWDDLSDFDLGKAAQWSDDVDAIKALPSAQPEKTQLSGESTTKDSTFDCISRQAAIDALNEVMIAYIPRLFGGLEEIPLECARAIIKMPSEQPQRIKGRWERKESDLSWWYECSECGESPLFDPYEHEVRSPFCPWCGAEMKGEQG